MMNLASSRVRVLGMRAVDDAFEDNPPVLPPLQDFSCGTITFSKVRPSPLEPRPNNRVNIQAQTTAISNRQKALADAQPLENGDSELDAPLIDFSGGFEELGQRSKNPTPPDPEQARKKTKLRHNEQIADFVHLPTPRFPTSNPKETRLPSLRPIADLYEPPSGAARFPPISSCGNSDASPHRLLKEQIQPLPKLLPKEASKAYPSTSIRRATPQAKKRRVYTRERTKWTEGETEQLVQGLAIYGMGRWKHILDHPEFHFHPSRTHVDLKDRFRVLFPPNEPHKWIRPMPEHISDEDHDTTNLNRHGEKPRLRKRKQAWTEREDQELEKGFLKHGYQWERIAKDDTLNFDNRSGSNIRDRFRLKYPEKWAEPRPAPVGPGLPRRPQGGTKGAGSRGGRVQRKNQQRQGRVDLDASMQQSSGGIHHNLGDIVSKSTAKNVSQMPGQSQGQGQTLDWLDDLLNEDWEGATGGIAHPPAPLRWEDMAVQTPMFEIG